jgi:polar amino acid transport system substrate-binding protein
MEKDIYGYPSIVMIKPCAPMKKIIFFAIFLALSLPVHEAGALTLAVEDAWEPYANPDGTGMSVEIVTAAFKSVGVDVVFEVLPYARVLHEVKSGKYVGGFNVAREASREDDFLWGREMLFLAHAHYYHHKSRPLRVQDARSLQGGEKIGVIRGYEYGNLFHDHQGIVRVWANRHDQIIDMLRLGRVQAVIMFEKTAGLYRRKMHLADEVQAAFPSEPSRIFVAFSRRHPEATRYLELLDEGLRRIKADGTYQAILDKY